MLKIEDMLISNENSFPDSNSIINFQDEILSVNPKMSYDLNLEKSLEEFSETKTRISSPHDCFTDFTLSELVDEQIWSSQSKSHSLKDDLIVPDLSLKELKKKKQVSCTSKIISHEDTQCIIKRNMKNK